MKQYITVLILLLAISTGLSAQTKYATKTGTASFVAESALMDANAENHQVRCVLNTETGEMAVSVLIRSFEFEKALMQTHFNADLNSEKFPKSTFEGSISNLKDIKLTEDGVYEVQTSGNLTLHGVTKKVTQPGTLTVKGGTITLKSNMVINTDTYGIPVRSGVGKDVKVDLNFPLELLTN